MEVVIQADRPTTVDIELHFYDKIVYAFTVEIHRNPYSSNIMDEGRHHVVGRRLRDVNKFLVKYQEYWYEEYVPQSGDGNLVVKLHGRDRATQLLRDAAMRAKPVVE